MCGIIGIWAPELTKVERLRLARKMLERLRHRGPDGAAVWDDEEITLGITRLAIVARDTLPRIHTNEAGTVHAAVNGEIYNHVALRESLAARGHDVWGGPDTVVIPHLYEDEGARFPIGLDGMFATALWDAPRRRLVLARDRAGEKPLFLTRAPNAMAFASEPGALLGLPWVTRDPAPGPLLRYLAHGYFAGSDCAFSEIQQVPPAHVIELGEGYERRTRYWRPWDALVDRRPVLRPDDAPAATRAKVEQAVQSRMPDGVPFGVFLSGGVDSALVVAFASRAGRTFPTFSLRMAERGYDESDFARLVASSCGTQHHELTMDVANGEEALIDFAQGMDQPLGDPSVLPTWLLARLASRHVPVVLTGEGGDELFAGYPTYLGHRYARLAAALHANALVPLVARMRRFRSPHHHLGIGYMAKRFLDGCTLSPFLRHHAWFGAASGTEARALLAPGLRAGLDEREAMAHLDELTAQIGRAGVGGSPDHPDLVAYQLLDFEHYLGGGLLTKIDRCAMAHGLESRSPFLRRELIEFALTLPDQAKLRGGCGKWALKQAGRGLLPEAVLTRRKQGFSPPFSAWVRGPLRATVVDRLSRERIDRAGVLDAAATQAVLAEHLSGYAERGRLLWTLLSLQMWGESWVMGQAPIASAARAGILTREDASAEISR